MIGRPVEVHGHLLINPLTLDFGDYDDLRPTLHLTLLQLLSLFSILFLLLLVYGLRCLRLKLSSLGRFADKEALGSKIATNQIDKGSTQLVNEGNKGWWWIDAVVGKDEDERVQVDERAVTPRQYPHGTRLARWSFRALQQPDPHVQTIQYQQTIPIHVPPPISMAKLIMSRHAHPPRRPRSSLTTSNNQVPQNSSSYAPQHASRSPSRLGSYIEVWKCRRPKVFGSFCFLFRLRHRFSPCIPSTLSYLSTTVISYPFNLYHLIYSSDVVFKEQDPIHGFDALSFVVTCWTFSFLFFLFFFLLDYSSLVGLLFQTLT